jgi:lysine-N-methylase
MSQDPAERERFESSVEVLSREERSRVHFASIRLRADGTCAMLDADRLCAIQRRHGEALLPDGCAVYPRYISRVGERLELCGSLSCPEVARLALLQPDSTELVEADEAAYGRGVLVREVGPGPEADLLDEVRATLYELAMDGEHPLTTRLFLIAHLAHECGALKPAELLPAVRRQVEPPLLQELARQFADQARPSPLAAALVLSVLHARRQASGCAAFRRVTGEVLGSFSEGATPTEALWRTYLGRRRTVCGTHGPRIDLYIENYARHFFMKEWPTRWPSLLRYVQDLLLRLGMVRFLLCAHPAAAAVPAAALDRLLTDIVYAMARDIEHDDSWRDTIPHMLGQRMPLLAHSVSLICL